MPHNNESNKNNHTHMPGSETEQQNHNHYKDKGKDKIAETPVQYLRIGILLIMGGFGVMGGGLMAPALPTFLAPFDVGEGAVGLVLSFYTLAAAITLPFTGLLLDIVGRKKVALVCLLVDGIFGLLCTVAPTFRVLLLFRFFQGMGIAGLVPVAMTVISDWFSGPKRLRVIGFLSGTIALSAVIIPFMGGLLAELNWRYPFYVYGFSILLAFFYFLIVPETKPAEVGPAKGTKNWAYAKLYMATLGKALKMREIREVFANSLVLFFFLYVLVTFLPVFLNLVHNVQVSIAGIAFSFNALVSAAVAAQAVRINRWIGKRKTIVAGYCFLSCSLILIPLWTNLYLIVISLVLYGLGMGSVQPVIFNWATTVGPKELTGSVVALFNTVKFAGMTISPVIFRIVYEAFGFGWTFGIAGILALLWASRAMFSSHRGYGNG